MICLFAPGLLALLVEWLAVSPLGFKAVIGIEFMTPIFLLVAGVGILVSPFFLFSKKYTRTALLSLLGSSACLISFVIGTIIGAHIRRDAFIGLADRSKPLIEAVKRYEQELGKPPESLEALVPNYLPQAPSTRLGAYPKYEYVSGDRAKRYQGNPWVIYVFTPSGGINFDQFMYFPLQNYPKKGYGGTLERIGDWAYVHE